MPTATKDMSLQSLNLIRLAKCGHKSWSGRWGLGFGVLEIQINKSCSGLLLMQMGVELWCPKNPNKSNWVFLFTFLCWA